MWRKVSKMISIEQACDIVSEREKNRYVAFTKELPDTYIVTALADDGCELIDASYTVDKETGKFGVYNALMYYQTSKDLKPLKVPEKYRFPGRKYE